MGIFSEIGWLSPCPKGALRFSTFFKEPYLEMNYKNTMVCVSNSNPSVLRIRAKVYPAIFSKFCFASLFEPGMKPEIHSQLNKQQWTSTQCTDKTGYRKYIINYVLPRTKSPYRLFLGICICGRTFSNWTKPDIHCLQNKSRLFCQPEFL